MTKQEAIHAMKQGKKITHQYFSDNEWMTSDPFGNAITLEDGVLCPSWEFWGDRYLPGWQDGYSEFVEMPNQGENLERSATTEAQSTDEPLLPDSLSLSQVLELIRYCAEQEFYVTNPRSAKMWHKAEPITEEEILTSFLKQINK